MKLLPWSFMPSRSDRLISRNVWLVLLGSILPVIVPSASQAAASVNAPQLSLPSGVYALAQSVSITATAGAAIYYTTNGTAPTAKSARYTGPIHITSTSTLEAVAIAAGRPSAISAGVYTIALTTPADVIDFSNGFAGAKGLIQLNGSADLDGSRLQLTKGGQYEAGSSFYATPVSIDQPFTTDFTFQLSSPTSIFPLSKMADGFTFTIVSAEPYIVPAGSGALGKDGSSLGFTGIVNDSGAGYNHFDVAIKFDLHDNAGEGPNSTGLYVNGASPTTPSVDLTGSGIDLHCGHPILSQISYDGTSLALTLIDTVTFANWSHSFPIDLPKTIGSVIAYVGFTAGTGSTAANQEILSWTYVSGSTGPSAPPPAAPLLADYPAGLNEIGLTTNGSASVSGDLLQITSGSLYQAGSAFYSTPLTVDQSFTTDFTFRLSSPSPSGPLSNIGDGMTFTILSAEPYIVPAGLNALGGDGADLGFAGIVNNSQGGYNNFDLAIKFDLYNNAGEGLNSTGLYVNGASPTIPAIDLTGTGIDLRGGHAFKARIAYDYGASTLLLKLTDTVTHATWSHSFPIDIPQSIGSVIGYVGFTGATGKSTAVQDILDWTVTTP